MHVPFCARRCTYCDFDFVVGRVPDTEGFLGALGAELQARGDEFGDVHPRTVYIGGGTPSLLGASGLEQLVRALERRLCLDAVTEFTVELNPEHVDARLLASVVALGVDRVSLGIQTFQPEGLAQLGRMHDAARAHECIEQACAAGLRVSADLVLGWPGQDEQALAMDLASVLSHPIDHVSVYGLTVEAGAPWPALVRRGLRTLPDEDLQADVLGGAARVLEASGFKHYEISNYGRGDRVGLHNQLYWTWHDYIGLGPSAASARYLLDGSVIRRQNPRGLDAWQRAPHGGSFEHLTGPQAAAEGLWLGLRCLAGIDLDAFLGKFVQVDASWAMARIAPAVAAGLLEVDGGRIRTAPGAWLVHDAIARKIL